MFPTLMLLAAAIFVWLGSKSFAATITVPLPTARHIMLGMIDGSDPNSAAAQDNRPYRELLASRALTVDPEGLSELAKGGDYVTVPATNEPADIGRVDRTSNSAITFNEVVVTNDVAVVQWNAVGYKFKDSDRVRAGHNFEAEYGMKLGAKISKRLVTMLLKVATAALDAADTPSADAHVVNVYSATTPAYPTLELLRQTKATLGDQANSLTTCVMHSASFQRLLKDLIANYGAGSVVGDKAATSGLLGQLLGINQWIITDLMPKTGAGSAEHNTLLLGPGALWTSFQMAPKIETDIDIDKPSTDHKLKVSFAAVAHLRFMKYVIGTGMNPSDADLANPASWDEAYEDHRRLLAAKLVTN